jgi:general secretion pathway protein N
MTSRRIAIYCVVGGVFYLATLVATAPAPWIARAVDRASSQKLQLRAPAGTLWTGSGRLYAMQRTGPSVDLGELRWKTAWPALFTGKLAADVSLGEGARTAHIELSRTGATIRGLDVALPATSLASFVPGLESLGPGGTLRIRSESQRIDAGSILGQAEIEWRRVRLARAPGLDLGSHVARLRGGGDKVDIELATLDGPLRLSGSGTFTPQGAFSLSGMAEHDAQQPPALATFLTGVCASYSQNRCRFQVRLQAVPASAR